jgi:hypothetical protein
MICEATPTPTPFLNSDAATWARAGLTEIGGLDQMVIGDNTQVASFFRRFTSGQAACPWSPFQACSAA